MAYNQSTWYDRDSEHPNRRTLTNVNDPSDVKTYDISRAEGVVNTQGTPITAQNMNDLETRIASAFTEVNNNMPVANPSGAATDELEKLKVGNTIYSVEGAKPETATIQNTPIASFSDGADNVPVSELIVSIDAVQSGSGTPSPTNIRSISGFNKLHIVKSDKIGWERVQEVIRTGYGQYIYPVRSQLEVVKGSNTLVFDVIGHDIDTPSNSNYTHSMTLALHDCLAGLQFDAIEGVFAVVSDSGLPAGTYHFKCTAQPWYASDVNKNIQFTTTQAVPKGGVLVLGNSYNASMIGKNIITYSTPASTSQIEAVAMSEGTGGTDLGELNRTKQTSGSLVHTNCIDRALLGNNNWKESALRQWLNSDKVAGSVWIAQNVWDRPASWNTNTAGFLYGLDPDFIKACGKVNKRTALNTVCDGGGYVDTEETFFLLARDEVFGNHENGVTEGATYPYFGANYSDYSSPNDGADSNRIKMRGGSAQYWWLRSPTSGNTFSVRRITPTGNITYYDAYLTYGVAPACCII